MKTLNSSWFKVRRIKCIRQSRREDRKQPVRAETMDTLLQNFPFKNPTSPFYHYKWLPNKEEQNSQLSYKKQCRLSIIFNSLFKIYQWRNQWSVTVRSKHWPKSRELLNAGNAGMYRRTNGGESGCFHSPGNRSVNIP